MSVGLTLCCSCSSSSTTRFMCSSSSPSSAACWGARAVEEALPRTAGPPGPRLRLLLLPPDSRSWFISKSQLATSWTFARLSEEEKGLAFCRETHRKRDKRHRWLKYVNCFLVSALSLCLWGEKWLKRLLDYSMNTNTSSNACFPPKESVNISLCVLFLPLN